MSQGNIDLSIIVPAYNEAERLPKTLRRFQEYLSVKPFSYEIIVALDGPTDNTREVLKDVGPEIKNLQILDRKVNRGKGFTVREGMLKASGHVRLFADADNSTDIAYLDKMLPFFEKNYDLVICSRSPRDVPGARQAVPQVWYKRFMGTVGNLFIQLVAVKGIWDTQCGFKAFRDYVAKKIFSQTVIEGWGFDIEVLALAQKMQYKMGVVPARWVNDPRSHVRFLGYLEVLWETVKIWWNLSRGNYQL